MEEKEFEIKPIPVANRDESGAKLFGWTLEEIGTVGVAAFVALFFVPIGYLKIATIIAAYLWVKHVKRILPEKYVSNAWRFYTRQDYYHSATQPDLEWRPPVRIE